MTFPLFALALSTAVCTPAPASPAAAGDSLRLVWEQAQGWDAFREAAHTRAAMWSQNWERAAVPEALGHRAHAVAGDWRLLVIAEPGCSDSLGSLPWIARLAADAPGLDLRIANATSITGADTRRKLDWYAEDEGRETLREIVEVLEAATGDVPRCPGLHPRR
jgi:acyl-homoserine lactone acylase PvdQ